MGSEKTGRRIFLVNKKLQVRYVLIALTGSLVTAFAALVFMALVFNFIAKDFNITSIKIGFAGYFWYLLILLVGVAFLVFFFTLLVSHKFAGPLYRFGKVLEDLSAGDLSLKAALRDGDELMDFKETLNSTIASLRSIVLKNNEKMTAVKASLEMLAGEISGLNFDEKKKAAILGELEKTRQSIGIIMGSIKV